MSQLFTPVTNGVPSNVPITFTTNAGNATPAANVINILGSGATATSGAGNTVTITTTASVFPYTDVAGPVLAAAVNNGYFITGVCVVTLPAAPTQGQVVIIEVDTASVVTITANVGQFIRMGQTITGTAGTATSSKRGDTLNLVYRSASQTWNSVSTEGTWALSP